MVLVPQGISRLAIFLWVEAVAFFAFGCSAFFPLRPDEDRHGFLRFFAMLSVAAAVYCVVAGFAMQRRWRLASVFFLGPIILLNIAVMWFVILPIVFGG
jgi:hypothetical protein